MSCVVRSLTHTSSGILLLNVGLFSSMYYSSSRNYILLGTNMRHYYYRMIYWRDLSGEGQKGVKVSAVSEKVWEDGPEGPEKVKGQKPEGEEPVILLM
jgi:hypothetical protein